MFGVEKMKEKKMIDFYFVFFVSFLIINLINKIGNYGQFSHCGLKLWSTVRVNGSQLTVGDVCVIFFKKFICV